MSDQQGSSTTRQSTKLELLSHRMSKVNIDTFSSYHGGSIDQSNPILKVTSVVSKGQKKINVTISFEQTFAAISVL